MGRPRTTIKKLPSGRWALARPVYGFAASATAVVEYDSAQAAWAALDGTRVVSQGGGLERRGGYSDGVAVVPTWSPLWHYFRGRDWIPLDGTVSPNLHVNGGSAQLVSAERVIW